MNNNFIEAFQNGDREVINELYKKNFVRLCHYANQYLCNQQEAEDVVSNLFEKLLILQRCNKRIGKQFATPIDIDKYLNRTVHNMCVNRLKQNNRHTEIKENVAGYEEELDFLYIEGLANPDLLTTVYNLPQRCVQVLIKIYLEEKSFQEVSTEMNVSLGAVSSLRKRGIDVLLKLLRREDFV